MDRFVIPPLRRPHTDNDYGKSVRISKEAYNALVDIANESPMSMGQIASKAILFASARLEYGYEKGEEQWQQVLEPK